VMSGIPKLSSISIIIPLFILSLAGSSIIRAETIPDSADSNMAIGRPKNVIARDFKYDRGEMIEIMWDSADYRGPGTAIAGYEIFRADSNSEDFKSVGFVGPGDHYYTDNSVEPGKIYRYKVAADYSGNTQFSEPSSAITPTIEFINWNLLNLFLIGLLVTGSVIYFISHAKRGGKLFIRKIAGLDAIDEAIGRATEMGRPILFVPGINDMDDVQTIAGITLLGRVAKVVAEYDIKINMPVSRSLVMTTARETIREAYVAGGRPDAYNDDMVRYVTDEQFGYVAAVDGIMVREKPATCFYLGAFFAESLILAETGNSIGAIQIAGTAQPAQLPFFVAACDYTLIGEELFAASAYLSNEPKQLGSLKGQDMGKLMAMIVIIVGVMAATISTAWGTDFFIKLNEYMQRIFSIQN
jgi:hypothetical protein